MKLKNIHLIKSPKYCLVCNEKKAPKMKIKNAKYERDGFVGYMKYMKSKKPLLTYPMLWKFVKICCFFCMLKSSHLCSRYSFYVVFGIVIVVAFITIIFVFRLSEVIHLFNSRSVQRIFICCIIYSFISCLIWISLLQSCVP